MDRFFPPFAELMREFKNSVQIYIEIEEVEREKERTKEFHSIMCMNERLAKKVQSLIEEKRALKKCTNPTSGGNSDR